LPDQARPAEGSDDQLEPLELFEWLPLLALALGRKQISGQQASVALFVALGTKGTTGKRGTVDMDRLEAELGLGRRQIWRHFGAIREQGWVEQTDRPTRGGSGEPGRRARYRLTRPRLVVSLETEADQVTAPSADVTHDDAPATESSVTSPADHVSLSARSCDTNAPDFGTLPPADGSPADGSPDDPSPTSTTERARDVAIQGMREDLTIRRQPDRRAESA